MVRRAVVLLFLYGIMLVLQNQGLDLMPGETEPLTLASIGFTALFAFTIGEIVSALGLPRVTGYILTGVLLGPYVGGILGAGVVADMKMFNTLALGLIATSAGLELDMKATARVGRTLAWTVLAKLVLLLLFVGGTFLAIQALFAPFALPGWSAAVALATVIAVLGLGTSPAIVLAVINDSGAKGRMADLVLAIAVVKDLVVVVSLAVALAIGKVLISPDGAFDPHVLLHVAQELGYSVLVGIAVAAVTWVYIRFVHLEMLLFVVAMILTVSRLSAAWHLELLLVFIVAGFVIRNFSEYEHHLLHPLETVALPVFVVFFTTAGAAIDLDRTWTMLPVALGLFSARLLALYVSGRVGGQLGGEAEVIRRHAWMAYIPQAGVTLGLVMLASQALPEFGELLGSLGVALVALNLFVGPVTLGVALGKDKAPAAEPSEEAADADPQAAGPGATLAEEALPVPAALPAALAQPLGQVAAGVEAALLADLAAWQPLRADLAERLSSLTDPDLDQMGRQRAVRRYARRPPAKDAAADRARLDRTLARLHAAFAQAPTRLRVPMDPALLIPPAGADPRLRARTLGRRLAARLRPNGDAAHRAVPVRVAARVAFEGRALSALLAMEDARGRCHAQLLAELEPMMVGGRDAEDTAQAVADRLGAAQESQERDIRFAVARSTAEAADLLARADSPTLPLSALGYGDVEAGISATCQALTERPRRWEALLTHRHQSLLLRAWLELGRSRVKAIIDGRFLDLFTSAAEAVATECEEIASRLRATRAELEAAGPWTEEALIRATEQTRRAFGRRARHRLRAGTARFRQQAVAHHLTDALARLIEEAPDQLEVISPNTPLESASQLEKVDVLTVPFHAILRHQLVEGLQPSLLRHHAAALELIGSAQLRLTEGLHVGIFALELAVKAGHPDGEEARGLVLGGLQRAIERAAEFGEEVRTTATKLGEDLDARLERALSEAEREAFLRSELAGRRLQGRGALDQLRGRLQEAATRARAAFVRRGREARGAAQRVLAGRNVRALRIRSGLERLDPAQMGAWVAENLPHPDTLELPALYQRLFSLSPLDDRRFLIHHRGRPFERLRAIAAEFSRGSRVAVLLRGAGGSGKSSLLNLIQLELGVDRIIRLDPQFSAREEGLISALAVELDCPPDLERMELALRQQPTAVLVDGLERWFLPSLAGVAAMERFQQLVVRAGPRVMWVVTVASSALVQIDQLTACRQAFSHHVSLRALDVADVARVVEARHQLSGLDLTFQPAHEQRLSLRVRRADPAEAYYRRLASDLRHPRAVAYAHLLSARAQGEAIAVQPPMDLSIPFMPHLGDDALTLLVELYRLGPMAPGALDGHLRLDEGRVLQLAEMLASAGLIERAATDGSLAIPSHLRDAVAVELEAMDRLPRGT